MKRIKIMLTAITVLAAVGGALALKAKTFGGGVSFCTTTDINATRCPISAPDKALVAGSNFVYTQVPDNFVCGPNTPCHKLGGALLQ